MKEATYNPQIKQNNLRNKNKDNTTKIITRKPGGHELYKRKLLNIPKVKDEYQQYIQLQTNNTNIQPRIVRLNSSQSTKSILNQISIQDELISSNNNFKQKLKSLHHTSPSKNENNDEEEKHKSDKIILTLQLQISQLKLSYEKKIQLLNKEKQEIQQKLKRNILSLEKQIEKLTLIIQQKQAIKVSNYNLQLKNKCQLCIQKQQMISQILTQNNNSITSIVEQPTFNCNDQLKKKIQQVSILSKKIKKMDAMAADIQFLSQRYKQQQHLLYEANQQIFRTKLQQINRFYK